MSLTLYDNAITEKIKKWVLDDNVVVLAPEESTRLFQWKADTTNDKPISLPLISISRERDVDIKDIAKKPLTYNGKVFNNSKGISDHLNAIPISIKYTINIYTRYLSEADEYARNFIFNLINYPKIELDIPYNDSKLKYTSYLTLNNSFSDNSDIPERLIPGTFSRMTVSFALNDAYLFSYNRKKVKPIKAVKIEAKLKTTNGEEDNTDVTDIIEFNNLNH